MKITNFTEANHYLEQFYANNRESYNLDTMRELLALLGNPQDRLKVIHVAGTSGKTSTCYYAASLLTAAGYKTGLTVSPHVDEINERVQINVQPVGEAEFCSGLEAFAQVIESSGTSPSWFEVMVAFAYWYFAREEVDYAVIEVGLGGLLDGTNVITRPDKVCVITDIGFDHTQVLGNTLAAIAGQKAGIIQQGNSVVLYQQDAEVMEAVTSRAQAKQASLTVINDFAEIPGLPVFQQRNFGLAGAAVSMRLAADAKAELTAQALQVASQTYIPGRMEVITYRGKSIVLDGAHNAQKLAVLVDALHVKYPGQQIAALVGFVEGDKDRLSGALDVLQGITSYCVATSFITAKDFIKASVDPQLVAEQAKFEVVVEPDVAKAFGQLLGRPESVLLVAGSFYLLNHIRPLMLKG
ncbi:MAG: hypothetical protein JWO41_323 [Candidatus Saccharibacteria bacterium]|nr:hypothetical protein [Candidatus Saccharibacteria bacterium]